MKEINNYYQSPEIEIHIFNEEESIATSGQGVSLWEQTWGGGS